MYSFFKGTYNQLVALDEGVKASWAQVENQLQRRYDLIPNLVETVKGYASHERETFVEVTNARAKVAGAKTPQEVFEWMICFHPTLVRFKPRVSLPRMG